MQRGESSSGQRERGEEGTGTGSTCRTVARKEDLVARTDLVLLLQIN